MEIIFFTLLLYLFLTRRDKKRDRNRKVKRKSTLDQELRELLEDSSDPSGVAAEIKNFLLAVYSDDKNSNEKYSDSALKRAQRIIDRSGPSGLYFMADIASQLAILSAAQINGFPTQITASIDQVTTPEAIINSVVKL